MTTASLDGLELEQKELERRSNIRELIFGAQDGLLVPLGVVSSVAGAFANNHIVWVAGISEGLAGAFSMATGAYLAYAAGLEVQRSAAQKEEERIAREPEASTAQLQLLFEREELAPTQAKAAADAIASSHQSLVQTLLQKKFGLEIEPEQSVFRDALLVGGSYLVSSVIPLVPYFFLHGAVAIVVSILATLVALFVIGVAKGYVTAEHYLKSGLQVLVIGSVSGLGGYLLGTFLPRLLGL